MITLFEQNIKTDGRRSSKGNQLKWNKDPYWYKADYTGYEGLSEYVISHLLMKSNLNSNEFVLYETEEMTYRNQRYLGCKSLDFLSKGWRLITLERLFHASYGESLYGSLYRIEGIKARAEFLVSQVERLTGLEKFGVHLSKLLTIDALFLNEDRHTHNIAVLQDDMGMYHLCPFFDHGAGLLSDIAMDYPLSGDLYKLIDQVQAKTLCGDFAEQLDAAEELYGQQLMFSFDYNAVKQLLDEEPYYPLEQKKRVLEVVMEQRRKYDYLFKS